MSKLPIWGRFTRWRGADGRDASGTTAVEFALIAPVLVLLTIGVVDLGMAIHAAMRLAESTRIGAQYALGDIDDTAGIQNAVLYATNLPPAEVTPTVSARFCECDSVGATCGTVCASGFDASEYITVTAEMTFESILSYPWLDTPVILTQSTTIRIN